MSCRVRTVLAAGLLSPTGRSIAITDRLRARCDRLEHADVRRAHRLMRRAEVRISFGVCTVAGTRESTRPVTRAARL